MKEVKIVWLDGVWISDSEAGDCECKLYGSPETEKELTQLVNTRWQIVTADGGSHEVRDDDFVMYQGFVVLQREYTGG